jgi:predicted nuclease of restriction endonuclease-like (RecB) superfamily
MDKKNKNGIAVPSDNNGDKLFNEVLSMIEQSRRAMYSQASGRTVFLFWEIGKRFNENILENKRADYGKQIVSRVATQLTEKFGRGFEARNLRRMMQFAEQFPNFEIVSPAATQLSWSHFVEILPLKSHDAKLFYLSEAARGLIGRDGLREMINRRAYERKEIADTQITTASPIPIGAFRDPYLFDVLGLKDEYEEADVEQAILREIEKFILEFGKGFAFVERQKRMIIDGRDKKLDLLFYNRDLRRLVAVELKYGRFDARDSGQLKLYLGWLDKYERREGEEAPIGLILCSESGREEIELLKLDRDGILVAEYWTALPPKKEFEQKIQAILSETRERLSRHNLLLPGEFNEE